MPKTSMDEYGPLPRTVRDVGRTGQVAVVDTEAMTELVKDLPNRQLRCGAVLPDAAEAGRGGRVDDESCTRGR